MITITTEEQLNEQPVCAVIVDTADLAWQKSTQDAWYMTGVDAPFTAVKLLKHGPFRLAWVPEVTA